MAAAEQFGITSWEIGDGLPSERIRNILQSRSGYLWLATANGLVRFDGVAFRVFNVSNSLGIPDNLVNRLFEDRAGRLWIGHDTGAISVLDEKGFHSLEMESSWLGVPVERFAEARDGTVWVLNRQGSLCPIADQKPGEIRRKGSGTRIVDLAADLAGKVWVADRDSVALIDDEGELVRGEDVPRGPLRLPRIALARQGGIWVLEDDRIRRWNDGDWQEERLRNGVLGGVTSLLELSNGTLACGTFRAGLELVAPASGVESVGTEAGLRSDWIRCLWEDREGSLWLGVGSGGLSRLRPRHVQMVESPSQWRDRGALTVSPASAGGLWVGIEGPGLYRYEIDRGYAAIDGSDLERIVVHSVIEDRLGRVWVGATGAPLQVLEDGRLRDAYDDPGLSRVSALLEARDGSLWIGTYSGPAVVRDGGVEWPARAAGVKLADVRCFAEDQRGNIWIGTMGRGVARYRDGQFEIMRTSDGLPSDQIWSLYADDSGGLWVGTYGKGISRIKDGEIGTVTTANGLPSDVICAMLDDGRDNLWVSSSAGLFQVARSELEACARGETGKVNSLVLDRSDGLATTDMTGGGQPVACRGPDGRLWFAAATGFAVVDPGAVREALKAPTPAIENVRIDRRVVRDNCLLLTADLEAGLVQVPPGAGGFEIDFTASSLVSSNRIQFRYRLDGLDTVWVEVGSRRTAYFSHVPPGAYTFRVSAGYDGADWSGREAVLRVEVQPFFWQTFWFRAVLTVTGAVAVGVIVNGLTRRRHRRTVESLRRAQAIERERTRIAHDIHDDLGAGLTQLSLLTHSARQSTQDPERVASRIDLIEAAVGEMTQAMDEIVWAVNPGNDTLEALASYLGLFARDYLQAANMSCVLSLPIDLPDWSVSAEVRHEIYLCVREALHNVVKHAQAKRVRFAVLMTAARVAFELADDGHGAQNGNERAKGRISSGVGMRAMARRMAQLGGVFELDESTGGGTTVRFILPKDAVRNYPNHCRDLI